MTGATVGRAERAGFSVVGSTVGTCPALGRVAAVGSGVGACPVGAGVGDRSVAPNDATWRETPRAAARAAANWPFDAAASSRITRTLQGLRGFTAVTANVTLTCPPTSGKRASARTRTAGWRASRVELTSSSQLPPPAPVSPSRRRRLPALLEVAEYVDTVTDDTTTSLRGSASNAAVTLRNTAEKLPYDASLVSAPSPAQGGIM